MYLKKSWPGKKRKVIAEPGTYIVLQHVFNKASYNQNGNNKVSISSI